MALSLNMQVPDILKQKLTELKNTSKIIIPNVDRDKTIEENPTLESFDNGRFILSKGTETGLFFVTESVNPGTLYIFDHQNGTKNAKLLMNYKFGRTAVVVDVLYFPLSDERPGLVVAITDRSLDKYSDYLAYISLDTNNLVKSFYLPHPITTLCTILDGTAEQSQFMRLASSFHNDWPHILLVGCRFGYVSLVSIGTDSKDGRLSFNTLQNISESPSSLASKHLNEATIIQPVRPSKNVHLSKVFYEDQMFVFRADDGATRCISKDKVWVSALHWIEKPGLAVVGFNFGGIMVISLRTSKVYSMIYLDSQIQEFAIQEPEEDPRPIIYLWVAYNSVKTATTLLMCIINFPKDEELTKNAQEYTFLEPFFSPCMRWNPDNCTRLMIMRTIYMRRRPIMSNNGTRNSTNSNVVAAKRISLKGSSSGSFIDDDFDTSLLFISWLERSRRDKTNIHGAIFDLNAFYAKRLIPRIQADNTLARQLPFISRFSMNDASEDQSGHQFLDIFPSKISQFSPPAFLNETIDQLYYPSTHHLDLTCISKKAIFQARVRPIQVQLICDLAQNIVEYFDSPREPARWIHAIGLANSAPADNINEERACLLRVIVHSFFPSIFSLIESLDEHLDWLKFIQKWAWKEVEITKTKFDDICSPLFADPPYEPSPSARGFIQHTRVFFKRASIIFEALNAKMSTLAEQEKNRSVVVQGRVIRQLRLYSAGIAFALIYNLLPVDRFNARLYEVLMEQFSKRAEKARRIGKILEIHKLLDEIISLNPENEIWQGKTAMEWYPPKDYKSFLPILLIVNITECAKLNLLGYYCLDLEAASSTFGSNVEVKDGSTPPSSSALRNVPKNCLSNEIPTQSFRNQKYFSLFLSFFLQENFSLDEMNRIRATWLEDKRFSGIEMMHIDQNGTENLTDPETDPMECVEGTEINSVWKIRKCKEEHLKMEWGSYKFNNLMLERKNYSFLLDLPPLNGTEPEWVQRCHAKCLELRRRLPSLFEKAQPLPIAILERYKTRVREQRDSHFALALHSQKQPVIPLSLKHTASFGIDLEKSTKLSTEDQRMMGSFENLDDHYEEMPLKIATPRKRQLLLTGSTPSLVYGESTIEQMKTTILSANINAPTLARSPVECNIIRRQSVKEKEWDRISKVTQTPLSLRKSISQSRLPIRQHRPYLQARTRLFSSVNDRTTAETEHPVEDFFTLDANGVDASTPVRQQTLPIPTNGQISPEPNIPKPSQPSSILKSDKHKSRLPSDSHSTRPRLRFAHSLFTTEQIPSRYERANDERQDTSFSNFTTLSGSNSSSASAMQSESITNTPVPEEMNENEEASNQKYVAPTVEEQEDEEELADEAVPRLDFDISTTTNWVDTHLRRSERVRKAPEHFEPEIGSSTRQSPVRQSPSRQEKEKTPSSHEKTPPPTIAIQTTPPSSRKRGRPPSAKKLQEATPPQTPRKRGRPSSASRKDDTNK